MSTVAVVLAAGQGTRMNSELPKVAHTVAGRPLVAWSLDGIAGANPERTMVVVGHGAEMVVAMLPTAMEHTVQEPQLGTGHAVIVALEALGSLHPDDTVVVGYGDMPLVPPDVYAALASGRGQAAAAMVTVELADPHGFGRVLRDSRNRIIGVVEERDATDEQRRITELNAGLYAFAAGPLADALAKVGHENTQGEVYLTDVIGILAGEGHEVVGVEADPASLVGVNTHAHLAEVRQEVRRRINERWMDAGVSMIDPARVYIDADVELEPGVVLHPDVYLEEGSRVAAGAVIGPDVFARASRIGSGAKVWYSVLRQAEVGAGVEVGPYASLRPETVLEDGSKAGTFVEMKKTVVGPGAKVPHLTYLGDTTVGRGANVGAGTVAANYNGFVKQETHIGADAFVGSNTVLVAPVRVGEGAMTAAGSAITDDVEDGAMGIARGRQRNIAGFAARFAARYRSRRPEER